MKTELTKGAYGYEPEKFPENEEADYVGTNKMNIEIREADDKFYFIINNDCNVGVTFPVSKVEAACLAKFILNRI